MSNRRKYIRITLPESKIIDFVRAKEKAEDAAMVKLSDTQYASRLIQWALEQQK